MADANGARRPVLVLGMHRSGTSLLAQVLDRAGVSMGGNLMPADEHNPEGYFEDLEIVAVHDRILAALDRPWGSVKATFALPDDWRTRPDVVAAAADLRDIAVRRMAEHQKAWGFKDPRTCRLLPLWLDILSELGATPVLVLANRSPAEVAQSLVKRDGISRHLGELLWLTNVLDVLDATDEGRALSVVTDWGNWFNDPIAQAARLAAETGIDEAMLAAVVRETVRPDLRRQRESATADIPLAREVHDAIRAWANGGDRPADLTTYRTRFLEAREITTGWAEAAVADDWIDTVHARDARIRDLEQRTRQLEDDLTHYRDRFDEMATAYQKAAAEAAHFREHHDEALEAYRKAAAEAAHFREHYDEALRVADRDRAAVIDTLRAILAEPGMAGCISEPGDDMPVADALVHIRNLTASAAWAAAWPRRRFSGNRR